MNNPDQSKLLLFRVLGIALIAFILVLMPSIGTGRFVVSGYLLLVLLPIVVYLEKNYPPAEHSWAAPLPDLLSVVVLVHVLPEYWHVAMVIGLMVSLAPSVSLSSQGHRIYIMFALILLSGMSLAGWMYDVEHWLVSVVMITAIYPSLISYAYWQSKRIGDLQQRSEAFRSFSQISGGVAHTLNNALTSVSGYTELALQGLADDERASDLLHKVQDGANRAGAVSRQLASLSGRSVEGNTRIEMVGELEILSSLIQHLLPEGITMNLVGDNDVPIIEGNRFELQQLFINVVSATARRMRSPGEILLTVTSKDNNLIVVVQDQEVETVHFAELNAALFPSLQQTEIERVAKTVVDQAGQLQVSIDRGRPTAWCIILPGAAAREVETSDEAEPTKSGPRRKILVIDDMLPIRELLRQQLEQLECDVVTADGGRAGLEALKTASFSQVFLDLKMPGMDGWECLDRIRDYHPTLEVTICSGYDPRSLPGSRVTSHVSYLQKPFKLDEVDLVLH